VFCTRAEPAFATPDDAVPRDGRAPHAWFPCRPPIRPFVAGLAAAPRSLDSIAALGGLEDGHPQHARLPRSRQWLRHAAAAYSTRSACIFSSGLTPVRPSVSRKTRGPSPRASFIAGTRSASPEATTMAVTKPHQVLRGTVAAGRGEVAEGTSRSASSRQESERLPWTTRTLGASPSTEAFPDAGGAAGGEPVGARVPAVAVPEHRDGARVGGPHGEGRAGGPAQGGEVTAELAVEVVVAALVEEVQVVRGDGLGVDGTGLPQRPCRCGGRQRRRAGGRGLPAQSAENCADGLRGWVAAAVLEAGERLDADVGAGRDRRLGEAGGAAPTRNLASDGLAGVRHRVAVRLPGEPREPAVDRHRQDDVVPPADPQTPRVLPRFNARRRSHPGARPFRR